MRAQGTWLLLLVASACGGFDNAPLRVGTVRGRLAGPLGEGAFVSVVGAPELKVAPSADGRFELVGVPAGARELLAVSSPQAAARVPVEVGGGRAVELGPLPTQPAAFAFIDAASPGLQSLERARLSVVGTPYAVSAPDGARVGPLPSGCWGLEVSAPGLGGRSLEACLGAGEEKRVELRFDAPDGTEGRTGCAEAGCPQGLRCLADGACGCAVGDSCGSGLSCVGSRCVGELSACRSCRADWECGRGVCLLQRDGSRRCAKSCGVEHCEHGTVCEAGHCVPDARRFFGCGGYLSVGSACTGDGDCRAKGMLGGLCRASVCTYACAGGDDCPDDFACLSVAGELLCRRK